MTTSASSPPPVATAHDPTDDEGLPDDVVRAIGIACDRIAPTWPLDQFIAVNPYWGWRSSDIATAGARLAVLAGTSLTMPRSWFRDEWRAGRLASRHLDGAATAIGEPGLAAVARRMLESDAAHTQPVLRRMALVSDLRDDGPAPVPGRSWTELMVHQISQHCASHCDRWQASWGPDETLGLFAGWRADPSVTHGFSWRHGRAWARGRIDALPPGPDAAIAAMLTELGVAREGWAVYLSALLASVNGWAAWFAYERWQARLRGGEDDTIVELLAIRLAWEWLLAADLTAGGSERERVDEWAASWALVEQLATETEVDQRVDWVLQTALERTYQHDLLTGVARATRPDEAPAVQAVFCIDVRSEVLRRALESTSATVQTRGFAGFFGLPIAYRPIGSDHARPQLPGLLAPAFVVTDVPESGDATVLGDVVARAREDDERWHDVAVAPSSMFSVVETWGLLSGAELVGHSLPRRRRPDAEDHGAGAGRLRPRLALVDGDPAAAAAIGKRVLTAMGLVGDLAPLVLLCGHGSHSANNPHAAGLDCGACGGQTGEVNARVLTDLLNAPAVRVELARLGVAIPDTTWFLAGLHDTATDEVDLFDTELAPPSYRERIERLAADLRAAGALARAERADALGLSAVASAPAALERRVQERASDWSQVRPEWGLAGNAAFVVAPRWRTQHLDLGGRCFLHDYDWRLDTDRSVLTLIMTAPMVVTNWINLQYHASTVDNRRYGSGNKLLHNVVGGRVGVFEGNGGDLRIGLPMQSLHDGQVLRHRPLRLSVFVEAPREAIDEVIGANTVVQELVLHRWLHLLRIDPTTGQVERRTPDGWEACETPAPATSESG